MTARAGWSREVGPPPAVAVGVDVLGGLFAINGGEMSGRSLGCVHYFDPSAMCWEDLEMGHTDWVSSMLSGDKVARFYENLRWKGWETEVGALRPSDGIGVYPFLFTKESRPIERTTRRPVPMEELLSLHFDLARQLGNGKRDG